MIAWKPSFAVVLAIVCLEGSAWAQAPAAKKALSGSAVDAGLKNSGPYYAMTNSFDPFGIAGVYPGYLGSGLSGYGPGANLSNNFAPWPVSTIAPAAKTKPSQARMTTPRIGKPGDLKKKAPSSLPPSRQLPRR